VRRARLMRGVSCSFLGCFISKRYGVVQEFQIIPHKGVGPIEFWMSREEVQTIFGEPQFSHDNREMFLGGFIVHFNGYGKVEFIALGKSPQFRAIFEDKCLHEMLADEAVAYVSKFGEYDQNDHELGYSYIFLDLQLSLWRGVIPIEGQAPDDPDGRFFEAVGVAERGYYEPNM